MELFKRLFKKPEKHIKCFEEIENVFHENDKNYDLVFFPLCSVNLSKIISHRHDWIHFVDVWNNGEIEDSYFNKFRTRDSIKFKLEDSKYYYFGDKTAFPKYENLIAWEKEATKEFEENKEEYIKDIEPQDFLNSNRKLREDQRQKKAFDYFLYVDQQLTYNVTKERYKREGQIINHKSIPKSVKFKAKDPIKQLGGTPVWIQQDMTPIDKNGEPLTFIGQVVGFNYMRNGSGEIFLFFDENTNEVIEIFQFC